ncbi:MAG TPA: methyltransferase domain-containing protein [Xanthomonadaceae bacterium]|nr:methyltransferase domain-containing protein [Xanthomonadaceae bacterium]
MIYVTEQVTPLYSWLAERFEHAVGSEFVGPEMSAGQLCPLGGRDVRHEDVTQLSFDSASIDHLLSFDVLEHVPDYRRALKEFARCIRHGGTLLLSAPFDMQSPHIERRARVGADGTIEHLTTPQYHGDPMNPDLGVLCYHTFGWSLLDELREVGFEDVRLLMVWSPERGYLGWGNVFVHARRGRSGTPQPSQSAPRMVSLPERLGREELLDYFRAYGHTDEDYLVGHFDRFRWTLDEFLRTWPKGQGRRVLDVGAHWLHQSVLWAAAGFRITALDLPETFSYPSVRRAASGRDIRLLPCESLEQAQALSLLPEDSFDVVLFTEVLEHLTFNPVAMWRQIYRVMAPGGRLLVTTPNAYRLRGQAWRPKRFLAGRGFGIPVEDIIGLRTLAHHWKEYSCKELVRYFALLSPDFHVSKTLRVPSFGGRPGDARDLVERALPFLRGNLHAEVDIPAKQAGIIVDPSW